MDNVWELIVSDIAYILHKNMKEIKLSDPMPKMENEELSLARIKIDVEERIARAKKLNVVNYRIPDGVIETLKTFGDLKIYVEKEMKK